MAYQLQGLKVDWYPISGKIKHQRIAARVALRRLRCGDIALVANSAFLSSAIRYFTRNDAPDNALQHSHVEIVKGLETDLNGKEWMMSWSAEWRGFIPRMTHRLLRKNSWGEVWRNLDITKEDQDLLVRAYQDLVRKGGRYDYNAVLCFVRAISHLFVPSKNAYTCSEATTRMFRMIGKALFDGVTDPEKISPTDICWRLHQISGDVGLQEIHGRWKMVMAWDFRNQPAPVKSNRIPRGMPLKNLSLPTSCLPALSAA